MSLDEMEKTTFITPWGTYYYKVMSFGLKNEGETYQPAMVTLFHGMIHKEIEVYMDDVISKSMTEDDQLEHLRKLFAKLWKFKLRFNPAKSTYEPIFKLLRKNQLIVWDNDCQVAFDKIKKYMQEPPILIPHVHGSPRIMYLMVLDESMGYVLGQHDDTSKKEHAIYYLSKKFNECKTRYSLLEKTCCALAWAAQRLRQYMVCHTTLLISKMDSIKYIFEKPTVPGRIAMWQMLLTEYDIQYVTQKAIKGGILFDYLAHLPVEGYQSLRFHFPDEDIMFIRDYAIPGLEPGSRLTLVFDGASNARGHGIGAVITSPIGFHLPFTTRLYFACTNNMEKYEACIYGIEAAIDLRIKILEVKWKNEASSIHIDHLDEPAHCLAIEVDPDDKPGLYDIKTFLEKQQYLEGVSITDKKALRRLSSKFFLNGYVLYKRNYDFVLLRCVDRHGASMVIKSIYEGYVGVHAKGPAMANNILRDGYYWTTIEIYYYNFVKRCHKCQIYRDKIIVPPTPLNVFTTSTRTSTGINLYSLVYGMEVILPIEVEIPSLRVIMEAKLDEAKWVQSRYNQLNLIEEKHLTSICHGQLYQRRLKQAFDTKVLPREYCAGELMLKRYSTIHSDPRGKWTPKYEEPFVIEKAFSVGPLILTTMDGEDFPSPVNADIVKKYYS
ncbi:uncharacterized protein LOC127103953 [Lathyrus oleraceus]|uniref:uncharacterized protein LOC127103953 n=1 Tax=Pisum sativum TaxID=3888 RepID=UPI0021D22C3F|nr:uncharacterized protein LOC127103953 [Pisum sativum]